MFTGSRSGMLERQKKFQLRLVNAQRYHGVDGRKTDQIDASWLAELLQCGLLKGSFVPPQWQRELRDLTRLRVSLLQDQNRIQNRIERCWKTQTSNWAASPATRSA